ncbi:DUF348 domain-containing protein, partial [Candidatus Saccharibacteria bacterium]|nr:DUF348 domain-containing protein [Candidatus Saccharibacteria bacterium]
MVKQRLGKVYRGGRRHIYQRPYILPIFGLLLGVAIVFGVSLTRHGQTLKVSDYHIVYLFDKGQRQTLNTQAKTVGALLKRLPDLKLSQADVVEPAIRTKIVEDNYRVNIYRARPVTIVDGGKKRITLTAQRSARVVAQKAGLKVEPEDKVVFAQGNLANNTIGEEVVVLRATTVQLNLYGKSIRIHTHAKTVGDLLIERGIILKKEDKIRPKVKTAIRKNLQIYVLRNGKSLFTREKIIPAPVEYVTDPSLSFGAEV